MLSTPRLLNESCRMLRLKIEPNKITSQNLNISFTTQWNLTHFTSCRHSKSNEKCFTATSWNKIKFDGFGIYDRWINYPKEVRIFLTIHILLLKTQDADLKEIQILMTNKENFLKLLTCAHSTTSNFYALVPSCLLLWCTYWNSHDCWHF